MDELEKSFKEGIFALRTRRFGKVAELMIQKLTNSSDSKALAYDLFDHVEKSRIEVKFSTVMKENEETINSKNVISQCVKANLYYRMMRSDEISSNRFDCNIQQIKRKEFDILYYGLFFYDKIAIFKMSTEHIFECLGYSDFQHRGNEGEGQFHINNDTYDFHMRNYFVQWLSYKELIELLET